jgi:hypothetical protein
MHLLHYHVVSFLEHSLLLVELGEVRLPGCSLLLYLFATGLKIVLSLVPDHQLPMKFFVSVLEIFYF